ncbi:primosomal protein DnaI [Macrococcus sp. DPC7161]|uniref:primosomal protein DnaI n=1 Tax=Macrococcus sp. DPC7161 TaxID=2507060 RepID=UPI00100B91C0|nr:primosomal protein DnaI [Macrococcus sp. DPC7161]RXK18212.1 primosomal protein DnaI [Macrococcus sp. DPC7161]
MKPLSEVLNMNRNLFEQVKKIQDEIVQDPSIRDFIDKNQIPEDVIERDLFKLQEFKDQIHECHDCEQECKNNFVMYHLPKLVYEQGHIKVTYHLCEEKRIENEAKKMNQYLKAIHMPKDSLNAKLRDIDMDHPDRLTIVKAAIEICKRIAKGENVKGMYIYGSFGTGKSYILCAIANELKQKAIHTTILYVPEFISELKGGFKDGSYQQKLDAVKKSPVLMLDDIGAEDVTPWVRDEVIGPILNYRMIEQLPTFFSSNFNFDELTYHFQKTRQGDETTKAHRIMERVMTLSKPFELNGKNYRHENE